MYGLLTGAIVTDPKKQLDIAPRLLEWFDVNGRKGLPWQRDTTPYRVWVSEIMLQQTQVATVIPYFERFMSRFPTVQALAHACEDAVLTLWTGLGYYSRARNLHKTAQEVVHNFNGEFPDDLAQLKQLAGIGPSTAGAIASIAMAMRAPILDGNVKRVLARYHRVAGWPGQTTTANVLWSLAERHTPHVRVADYTQAIMDLGATLCTRSQPSCDRCPLNLSCLAYRRGDTQQFPGKKPKKNLPVKAVTFIIARNGQGAIWLEKRPSKGIWGGLWSFPEVQDADTIGDWCRLVAGAELHRVELAPILRHTFSHYHLDIQPAYVVIADSPANGLSLQDSDNQQAGWISARALQTKGLPAPVVKLIKALEPTAG